MRRELPLIRRGPDAAAHPYPYQLATLLHEYLQATMFLLAVSDAAAGRSASDEAVLDGIRADFEAGAPGVWDQGWALVGKYDEFLAALVKQNATIAMASEWDWYVRRLGKFVAFGLEHVAIAGLDASGAQQYCELEWKPMDVQLDRLARLVGPEHPLESGAREALIELFLVRNLGLHSHWDVDERYLSKTACTGWQVGDFREIADTELHGWHSALVETVNSVSIALASTFANAPDFSA
jgi:hypothetical protein